MSEHQDLPNATNIGELDLHLRYMRLEVQKLVAAMPNMATKADIAELSRKFDGYATHDDVRALRTDVEVLRNQMESGSVRGSVKTWAEWAQRFSAIAAFLAVCAVSVAHLVERLR
jgi:hypothetical protein